MERSRFTEDQVIGILKALEAGISIADLCRPMADRLWHRSRALRPGSCRCRGQARRAQRPQMPYPMNVWGVLSHRLFASAGLPCTDLLK